MDFLRRIEDDVRNLGTEVKKKYPEVRDAADRALVFLKSMREIMRGGEDTPKIAKYRSADISAPYILACNYVDANLKTVMLSLNGLQMLLNYEVVPPSEAKNILRILGIQASSGRSEVQLKVLQILLQLANSLSVEVAASEYLSEANVCAMIQLALQLCESKNNVSVSSTAFATVRQMVALLMDTAAEVLVGSGVNGESSASASPADHSTSTSTASHPSQSFSSTLPKCAVLLIQELALFLRNQPGEWMKGLVVPPSIALDLLHEVISGWKLLFQQADHFRVLLKTPVISSLKPLLRNLREDYIVAYRTGAANAGAMTTRVVRLARCLLLHFLKSDFALEIESIISLMVHTLQPERGMDLTPLSKHHQPMDFQEGMGKLIRGGEEAVGMAQNALLSRLSPQISQKPTSGNLPGSASINIGYSKPTTAAGVSGSFLVLGPQGVGPGQYPVSPSMALVPSHPAGVCLEALLSLLLSDSFMERVVGEGEGEGALVVALTSISVTVAALLAEGSASEGNMRDFESSLRGSSMVTLVEGVLIGAETDVEAVGRSIQEHVVTSGSVSPAEVLVLAFQVTQVLARVLVRCSLLCQANASSQKTSMSSTAANKRVFISKEVLQCFRFDSEGSQMSDKCLVSLRRAGAAVCDRVFESQVEACTAALQRTEEAGAIRRCLGILSEWALASGLLGLQRPTDVIIATMCRFTVPRWHGHELLGLDSRMGSTTAGPGAQIFPSELFRWRHVQAAVRLLQVVHVLADVITDWDAVMDCFEQLISLISSSKSLFHEDVTALELEKIGSAIERFKVYSVFISDEALVRVMASLVALSLNSLAVFVSNSSGSSSQGNQSGGGVPTSPQSASMAPMGTGLGYSIQDGTNNPASFSLMTAVEMTTLNAYRVACVWQLMTSHLRMVAAHKLSSIRMLAVAATYDVIGKTLEYMRNPSLPPDDWVYLEDEVIVQSSTARSFLSDALLFNGGVFQCFETTLAPRQYHRNWLIDCPVPSLSQPRPQLGQEDLLGSLKALSIIRYADVRAEIVQGLLTMLQGGGQAVSSGWGVVIEILTSVAASMTNSAATSSSTDIALEDGAGAPSEEEEESSRAGSWPRSSLAVAFSCMSLIIDDFLEVLPVTVIRDVIYALSVFSSQVQDVNISLTSVEMLWKVADFIMTIAKQQGDETTTSSVLQFTMSRLLSLCTDSRPEIRNCATNTLFSAMAANAQLLSSSQWQITFDDVVFPLFTRSEAMSNIAMMSNEEAIAPELKKGVRMTVHHSRDTAHKQWSETRVLALRGVARLLRSATRLLIGEAWFRDTWQMALKICMKSIQSANGDLEVALAAVDAIFVMLKTVASQAYKTKVRATRGMRVVGGTLVDDSADGIKTTSGSAEDKDAAQEEEMCVCASEAGAREALWQLSWTCVRQSVSFDEPGGGSCELALHMCNQLRDLFGGGLEGEFRYSENVKNLLEMVVILARPRVAAAGSASARERRNSAGEIQLHRGIMSLLRDVRPNDPVTLCCLLSALAELCFAVQPAVIKQTSPQNGPDSDGASPTLLGCVDDRLRTEAGEYLTMLIEGSGRPSTSTASSSNDQPPAVRGAPSLAVCADVITARFTTDLCDALLSTRSVTGPGARSGPGRPTPSKAQEPQSPATSGSIGFLSSIGKMLTQSSTPSLHTKSSNDLKSNEFIPRRAISIMGMPLHKLDPAPINTLRDKQSAVGRWTCFPCPPAAIRLLTTTVCTCLPMLGATASVQVWSQCIVALQCVLSPWLTSELAEAGLATSEAQTLTRSKSLSEAESYSTLVQQPVSACLDMIVYGALEYKVKQSLLLAIVEMLESVSRFSVHALLALMSDSLSDQPEPPVYPTSGMSRSSPHTEASSASSFALNIAQCVRHLVTVCSHEAAPRPARQRALLSVLVVNRDLVQAVLQACTKSCEIAISLRNSCSAAIDLVSSLTSSPDLLPSPDKFDPADPAPALASLLQHWRQSLTEAWGLVEKSSEKSVVDVAADAFNDELASVDLSLQGDDSETSSGPANHSDFRVKGHVLLVLQLAVRVLMAEESLKDESSVNLRRAAQSLVNAVDVRSLVDSYRLSLAEIWNLRKEKLELEQELISVRSAASMPF